jgi:cytochrome c oxidase subunit II
MRCVDTGVRREHQSRAGNVADHRRLRMKRNRAAKQSPTTWAPAVLVAAAWFGQRGEAWADDNTVHSVQNIFAPVSGPAETIDQIAILVLVICTAIFVIVGGLTVYAVVRYRRRGPQDDVTEPPQVYGSTAIELAWSVPPVLVVVVLVLVTARTIGEIRGPRTDAKDERVEIIGHRYWWEVRYPKDGVTTANEIHVPVNDRNLNEATQLILKSVDTNHGFWVPQLAGKSWVVPNHENAMFVQPWETGIYLGNCTVFCGTQHANMLIRVMVDSKENFQKWLDQQKQASPADTTTNEGRNQFLINSCGSCHRVNGTAANGVFGPDLTHFATRQTLGSGVAPNDDENLRSWLRDPQVLKPGCLMPNMKLSNPQVEQILAYLKTLK